LLPLDLSMTVEFNLGVSSDTPAEGTARIVTPWLVAAAVFAVAALLRSVLPFNVDVSWWLTVSERMLDGQRLYVDIIEINPPMAGLVYLPGVALARAIHLSPEVVTDGLIFILIGTSLVLTWMVVRPSSLRDRFAGGALAVWAVVLLAVLPMYDFGQREHLALVAILPVLAVAILRGNHERVTPAAVLIAGLSAGITMSFKPYFAFAVGSCILAAAACGRNWRILFAPENWIAGTLVVIYGVCTFVFYPEYFTIIYPLVRDVYLLLKVPMPAMLLNSATALWLASVITVLALQSRARKLDAATFILLAGSFGFLASFLAQRKAWDYHAYPMLALALLAAGFAISAIEGGRRISPRLRVAAMLGTAAIFANACIWFNGSIDVRPIEAEVARLEPSLGPHPKILVLSGAAVIGHPMVRTLHGIWISRQEEFWVREIVRRARLDGTIDSETPARLKDYVNRERAGMIEDFKKQPPDVVLIDNHNSDWGDWARADPELSVLLQSYVPVQTVEGIEILRRN
jgi:hypothetical protein